MGCWTYYDWCNKYYAEPYTYTTDMTLLDRILLLQEAVKELGEQIDNIEDDLFAKSKAYIDEQIAAVQTSINAQIKIINDNVADLEQWTQGEVQKLLTEISLTQQLVTQIDASIDKRLDSFRVEILNMIENLLAGYSITVVSPVTGISGTVQQALDDIYSSINVGALTAQEFDSLALTADEFDKMQIACGDFDSKARWIFFKRLYMRMRSPFTGQMTTCCDVLVELFDYVTKQTQLTVGEFDALQETAEAFDGMDLTTNQFDFDSKAIFG